MTPDTCMHCGEDKRQESHKAGCPQLKSKAPPREYKPFTGESVVRDPDRIDHVIEKVREIWKKYPDLRLGQLLDNAVVMHTLPIGQNHIFLVEDEELVKALDGLEERLKERDHEG